MMIKVQVLSLDMALRQGNIYIEGCAVECKIALGSCVFHGWCLLLFLEMIAQKMKGLFGRFVQ